jgi:ATP-binding cassette subfamily F protein uup
MAPPLLTLDGIVLTFGGTPLLDGAELSASAGDRIALVGRNGSGKSTLLKIAAGLVEPQDGELFRQPSATIRYLPQEPDMEGFATAARLCRGGAGPADDPYRASYLLEASRADRRGETRGGLSAARRGAQHSRASWRRNPTSCCSTSRPTISTWRSSNGWRKSSSVRRSALVVISHDRRFLERVSRNLDGLARSRP